MTTKCFAKLVGAVVTLVAMTVTILSIKPLRARADDDDDDSRIRIGFEITPVPLNLQGKDPAKVGLGSYFVNAIGDCNGCHTSGAPPLGLYPYTTGYNPYFNQPEKIDPAVYLAGGTNFGTVGTPTGPNGYSGPAIISRNLTPDKTGRAEGGRTLDQFKQILRYGTDFDHIHPTCTAEQIAEINAGGTPVCIPTGPIVYDKKGDKYNNIPDGDLLQVMPWPTFSNMSDHDIEAIYEYLSAIPCIDNNFSTPPAGAPNELRNDCGDAAAANVVREPTTQQAMRSRRAR